MGPGFVHPGNFGGARELLVLLPLQWGPGLYTREIIDGNHRSSVPAWLQWGPGLYTREIGTSTIVRATVAARFNGARVCTPGKSARDRGGPAVETVASMGPGFVHPGNTSVALTNVPFLRASMGPGFVHPGNPFREKRT